MGTSKANTEPPTLFWKVIASLFYLMPWIDSVGIGRQIYHTFPWSTLLYVFPGTGKNFYKRFILYSNNNHNNNNNNNDNSNNNWQIYVL